MKKKKKTSLNQFQIFKYYSNKHLLLTISISRHWKQQLMEAGIAEKAPLSFCGFSTVHTEGLTKSSCPHKKINFKFGLTFEQKGSGNKSFKEVSKDSSCYLSSD